MKFTNLTDLKLIESTHEAIDSETAVTTNVVRHFVEIHQRDLYLARGFGSMFLMAREEFGYDKASAQRRVNAMQLALAEPRILELIDRAELCLQSAADMQTFLNRQRGKREAYSREQITELVSICAGRSSRDVQFELISRDPLLGFKESKKMVAKDRMQITYTTSIELEEKLERIISLRSHANPYMNREELLDYMAELVLEKIDPARRDHRIESNRRRKSENEAPFLPIREEVVSEVGEVQLAIDFETADGLVPAQEPTRYVDAETKRAVRKSNDDRGCEFEDEVTGHRCGSHHQLQFDHIQEFSRGGSNSASNLRVLCAKHNRFRWRSKSQIRVPELAYNA